MKEMESLLKDIGLTVYQAKIYLALLRYGPMNGAKLMRLTGMSSTKCYDTISQLLVKGFIKKFPGKGNVVAAIEPKYCLKAFLNETLSNIACASHKFIKNIEKIPKNKFIVDGVWLIDKKISAYQTVKEKMLSAKNNIVIISNKNFPQKYRKTLARLNPDVDITVRTVEEGANIIVIDREHAFILPEEAGGVEIKIPSVARLLASLI